MVQIVETHFTQYNRETFLEAKFRNPAFMGSLRTSTLNRGTACLQRELDQ